VKALAAATTLLENGDAPAALARATDAWATLDVDDEAEAVVCLIVIGRCHQALADHAAARDSLDQAHQRAVELGEPRTVVVALGALATQDRVEGHWAQAEQRFTTALTAAAQCDGHDDELVA
jgi:MalT-like TPR region